MKKQEIRDRLIALIRAIHEESGGSLVEAREAVFQSVLGANTPTLREKMAMAALGAGENDGYMRMAAERALEIADDLLARTRGEWP